MIVDYMGFTLMDSFVKPILPISDYRTNVTGIVQEHLESGKRETSNPSQLDVPNGFFRYPDNPR